MSERAARIQYTLNTPGWQDILAIRDEYILEKSIRLQTLMLASPDKLTEKSTIAIAARARAVKDFFDDIEHVAKDFSPNPEGGE